MTNMYPCGAGQGAQFWQGNALHSFQVLQVYVNDLVTGAELWGRAGVGVVVKKDVVPLDGLHFFSCEHVHVLPV